MTTKAKTSPKTDRPWYQVNAKAGKKPEILIYDVIGQDYWGDGKAVEAKKFVKDLQALGDVDVDVRINSPGGSVWEGLAIYNALLRHKGEITTHIDGIALSMASVIAMAGKTIIMPKNAMMMIHKPLTFAYGNAEDMQKTIEMLDKFEIGLISAYQDKTGLEYSKLAEMLSEETWLTGEEALALGFCNEVTSPVEIAAMAFDLSNFQKVPDHLQIEAVNRSPVALPAIEIVEDKGELPVMAITMEQLKNEAPELINQLKAEGKNEGMAEVEAAKTAAKAEGAKEERERIQAIEDLPTAGFETIINECKFDGKTKAPDVAMKILAAQKQVQSNTLTALKNDAPAPVAPAAEGAAGTEVDPLKDKTPLTMEEATKLYNQDEKLRKTFSSAKNFFHYRKNM